MNTPLTALYVAGALHFGILVASALAPHALQWRDNLAALPKLLRQMFWVYGAFIVLMIVSFGILTLTFAPEMAAGEAPLARSVCALIAVFWGLRLAVQLLVFDAKPFLTTWFYATGYHALTLVFVYLFIIYGWAALGRSFIN